MTTYRLKETHPLHQKVERVMSLCEELGIEFSFSGHEATVTDKASTKIYTLADNEEVGRDYRYATSVNGIPHLTEWTLTYKE